MGRAWTSPSCTKRGLEMDGKTKNHQLKDLDFAAVERSFERLQGAAGGADAAITALDVAFQKAGIWQSDAAREFAAEMLNKPYDQVTPEERANAKSHPLFYLKMYGSRPPKP